LLPNGSVRSRATAAAWLLVVCFWADSRPRLCFCLVVVRPAGARFGRKAVQRALHHFRRACSGCAAGAWRRR
jgi:hypothetical protein